MKVLLFSSVCKPTQIFNLALESFFNQLNNDFTIDFCFYNDNFSNKHDFVESINFYRNKKYNIFSIKEDELSFNNPSEYNNHNWDFDKIDRVIRIKNKAIEFALVSNYDYLFLVDADLVLHPNTLEHLISLNKDFVFEIFWTLFFGDPYHKPNAWDFHSWAYHDSSTILKLANQGTYIVGGGGACTLISNRLLRNGLNFNRLLSLPYQGEDRHFCTRAQALGFDIWIDTMYPCFHVFDEKLIIEASKWFNNGASPKYFEKWLDDNWKQKVIKSFEKKNSFLFKVRKFQYEVRRTFKHIFLNAK